LLAILALGPATAAAAESPAPLSSPVEDALPIPDVNDRIDTVSEGDSSSIDCDEDCAACCCTPGPLGPLGRWWHYRAKPRLQASHWGYAENFHERPFGTVVREHLQAQVFNGLADQMVLYQYDFSDGPAPAVSQLNPRGRERLRELARMSNEMGLPITIERARNNVVVDHAHRRAVLRELDRQGIRLSPEMVVVAKPRAFGIGGEDAEIMFSNLLEQTRSRGVTGTEGAATETMEPVGGGIGN